MSETNKERVRRMITGQWYQHVWLGWFDTSRARPENFQARLHYFLKMTAQNKRYGMVK